jgi:DNA-binding NarL/FixJ family response regulator
VLLLDHREFARAGLRTVLENQPDISVVGETGDRRTALRLWRELAPDVVVAGDRTAERELATALAQDEAARPGRLPRLITLVDSEADIPAAATVAWTAGFLPQSASSGELTSAVRMVSAGYRLIAPGQALAAQPRPRASGRPGERGEEPPATVPPPRRAPAAPDPALPVPVTAAPPPSGNLSGNLSGLTPRERDVLELLTLGMSNAEISAKLMIGQSTVKSHVRSMLAKLGLRNRAEAIIYSYENARPTP